MRIVMIGPFGIRVRGTMWRRALPLARALIRRGHHVTMILPPWDSPADAGHTWEDGGVLIVNTHTDHPVQIVSEMLRLTVAHRPDVVHVFKPKAYAGAILQILWYLRATGLWRGRLVLDADDWEGPGGWNERAGYTRPMRWLFAWQERWGFRHADALTVASRWLAAQAHVMGTSLAVHIPNGIDIESWPERPTPPPPPTALLLTRFVEFAPAQLPAIWRYVHARLPDARLIVAGGSLRGEDRIARRLMTAELPHAEVQWLGEIPSQAIPSLCARAHLAFFPAKSNRINRAKCPARLADVMAAGLPVVASQVGEHETYIVHKKTGLLVPPGDDIAMA
ncbi:MAG: glycosyltransferase, partial [Anaerolineae bacterium]|nr:glycosyltransferase [Anaerolineae bacterium]